MKQKGRIPRTNAAIILLSLTIIGTILIVYPMLDKTIGIDLYGFILILFVIVLALLDFAGVNITRAIKRIKKMEKPK
ncbi:MAG: hypothetical protein CL944_00755 [Candidatus Diapherotrites archaeon]|uniref:Uncharacterized protein n=1 Tax=Candidatus Iainarchaeum sp. TaxID=3101447 RepID=A0A2D6LP75_9ARCH|nr:hypothetical protein [Candidatus Diapherotrites archaeon]|tara:strand:+ start:8560 stop:8790 length:231 start_codon:yes stop_codon:yes gene_type:complete